MGVYMPDVCPLNYYFVGSPDLWPEALDGLLSTIADLAESIHELITATERAVDYNSNQGMYNGHRTQTTGCIREGAKLVEKFPMHY